MTLNELIPRYAQNKIELDSYKKICDDESKQIKDIMQSEDLTEYDCGTHTAKITIQHRQTMNEDKLLQTVKELGRNDLIRTKEYVDMDLLEKAMYNSEIQAQDIEPCMVTKEVVTLKVKTN